MGLYRDHIFPYMLEWLLGNRQAMEFRRRTLADARGSVLEIGCGTRLALSCYPTAVDRLMLIDPERLLAKRVAKRIAEAPFPVEMAFLDAAHLPFAEHSFDTVVSTWTLCTVPEVEQNNADWFADLAIAEPDGSSVKHDFKFGGLLYGRVRAELSEISTVLPTQVLQGALPGCSV